MNHDLKRARTGARLTVIVQGAEILCAGQSRLLNPSVEENLVELFGEMQPLAAVPGKTHARNPFFLHNGNEDRSDRPFRMQMIM